MRSFISLFWPYPFPSAVVWEFLLDPQPLVLSFCCSTVQPVTHANKLGWFSWSTNQFCSPLSVRWSSSAGLNEHWSPSCLGPMEAGRNRRDKPPSGAVVPAFLLREGLNDLWRSLPAPGSVYLIMTGFHSSALGLFIGSSSTCWGRTSWDFRVSPFEPELRQDKLPALFTFTG